MSGKMGTFPGQASQSSFSHDVLGYRMQSLPATQNKFLWENGVDIQIEIPRWICPQGSEWGWPGDVTGGHFYLSSGRRVGSRVRVGPREQRARWWAEEVKAGGDERRGGMLSCRREGKCTGGQGSSLVSSFSDLLQTSPGAEHGRSRDRMSCSSLCLWTKYHRSWGWGYEEAWAEGTFSPGSFLLAHPFLCGIFYNPGHHSLLIFSLSHPLIYTGTHTHTHTDDHRQEAQEVRC